MYVWVGSVAQQEKLVALVNPGMPVIVAVVEDENAIVPFTTAPVDFTAGAAQLADDPQLVTATGLDSFAFVIEPANIVFVTVPVSADPTSVPLVGNVTAVFPVSVPANVYAPENAALPPRVSVLEPLFTPVPP